MNSLFIIIFLIILLIVGFNIHAHVKDQKLLKTVTKLNRGTRSEREMVLILLKSGFNPKAIFHDLYLKNENRNYSQIDLVVATKVGILVFEIKEYSGWIFGNRVQRNWTQVLAYGEQKFRFYNPILQNQKHITDLKNKLSQFKNIPFFSIIVFFGNCELKDISVFSDDTFLAKSSDVMEIINGILQSRKDANYTNKWDIIKLLEAAVKNGESSNIIEKHIKNISLMKNKYRIFN